MHILTICQRGNVRSATVMTVLKDFALHEDTVCIGSETATPETFDMLARWSEIILICGNVPHTERWQPFIEKVTTLDIGDDVWGKAMHPDLVRAVVRELKVKTGLINGNTRWPEDIYLALVEQTYRRT